MLLRHNTVSFSFRVGNFPTPEGGKWFGKHFHFPIKEVARGSGWPGDTISNWSLNPSCLNYAKLKLSPLTCDKCADSKWPVLGLATQTRDRAGRFAGKAGVVKGSKRNCISPSTYLHCSRCSWIIRQCKFLVPTSATPMLSQVLHVPWRNQAKPSPAVGIAECKSSQVLCKGRGWQMLPSVPPLQLATNQKPQRRVRHSYGK